MKNCEHCGVEIPKAKSKNRFCNRSCSNAWQHANDTRRAYVNDKTTWDWWVQSYGLESAIEKKELHRSRTSNATKGEKNPMYGRTDHTRGIKRLHKFRVGKTLEELYGIDKAQDIKNRISDKVSGERNPAFGKVYDGAGRSKYQGCFRNVRFRSSWELSFLIHLGEVNVKAEPFSIPYVKDGRRRTYRPDFQVGNVVYEIKPSVFLTHQSVIPKLSAGVEFCQAKGLEFRVMTENEFQLFPVSELLLRDDVVWNKGVKK